MNGELTPLMAQQMSGRAGRRGLDTQGNLVYVGAPASFIRSLMIGKVGDSNMISNHTPTPYQPTLSIHPIIPPPPPPYPSTPPPPPTSPVPYHSYPLPTYPPIRCPTSLVQATPLDTRRASYKACSQHGMFALNIIPY